MSLNFGWSWSQISCLECSESGFKEAGSVEKLLPTKSKPFLLFQTSGSTGKPKWVVYTRQAFLERAKVSNDWLQVRKDDTWGLSLPPFHVAGCAVLARAYVAGIQVKTLEGVFLGGLQASKWQAEVWVRSVREEGVTLTSLVPTQVFDIVLAKLSAPSCLRVVLVGGGVMSPELARRARSLGWPLLRTYGMTEAGSQIATSPLSSLKSGNDKMVPLPGFSLDQSENGCLVLTGEALFEGYVEGERFHVPWGSLPKRFVTMDKVRMELGYLEPVGRSDECIKISGELVSLIQLRSLIEDLRLKFEVSFGLFLVSVPDERLGMRLELLVEGPVTPAVSRIVECFHAKVPAYARLTGLRSVKQFTRSSIGKIIPPQA